MRLLFQFLAAAVAAMAAAAASPAAAEPVPSYYVEFRAAENGVYGHSYVAYGRLDRAGRPVTAHYADVHPTGELVSVVIGHFLPMDAETVPEDETLRLPVVSRYRLLLGPYQYRRLVSVIARTRARVHGWSILGYNCNDFVADVARGMGLRAPNPLSLPYDFIPDLQRINEAGRRPARFAVSGRRALAAGRGTLMR